MPELSKKLRDGSLPPDHVFYAYVGKVGARAAGQHLTHGGAGFFWEEHNTRFKPGSNDAELATG